ncbi:MAG: PRC-barrel domain-containing protein [Ignavibacteriales bacterium]|nr:PRC-barrel domain-containing protein [Ignavibacteriales bacterium]
MSDTEKNLFYLEELPDYQVASHYSDVTGWDVVDAENRTIGKVSNLLVNIKTERVVYLDVEVDKELIEKGYETYQVPASEGVHGFLNKDGEDHLIIPIGMVCLDKEQKRVFSSHIDYKTFAKAKRIKKRAVVDNDYELVTFRHYQNKDTIELKDLDDYFYNRKEFEDSLHEDGKH